MHAHVARLSPQASSKACCLLQVVIGFGWGAALSFAAAAVAVKIWMFAAVVPFLVLCTLVLETICTAELTKVCSRTLLLISAVVLTL